MLSISGDFDGIKPAGSRTIYFSYQRTVINLPVTNFAVGSCGDYLKVTGMIANTHKLGIGKEGVLPCQSPAEQKNLIKLNMKGNKTGKRVMHNI
jgi:hypothetical protein